MKVFEALRIIQAAPNEAVLSSNFILRFSPQSVQTFFNAHHQVALSERKVIVSTGLHDNPSGTVERAAERPPQCLAVHPHHQEALQGKSGNAFDIQLAEHVRRCNGWQATFLGGNSQNGTAVLRFLFGDVVMAWGKPLMTCTFLARGLRKEIPV
jgi:hypothetical protein